MKYCAVRSPEGWYCVLVEGHDGQHLSIDNSAIWRGTPGAPVWWDTEDLPRETTSERRKVIATHVRGKNKEPGGKTRKDVAIFQGFTGIECTHCGSPNTVQTGTCLTCTSCGETSSCG